MALDFRNSEVGQPSLPAMPGQAQDKADEVKKMLIDYNKRFARALPAKHRDKEIFQCVSQLMMSQKSSSLLVGAPGTGKTKIVEEIARLIATQSPYTNALNEYTVYELPLSGLMAGTSYRGQLENKVKALVEWLEKNKVILFIDEVHQLCGRYESYASVAQMLKPAMARGSIKIIGATTLQESKNLLDDPAFNRRFNKVQVCELSIEQTKEIVESLLGKMQEHYGCGFAPGIADKIVSAAEKARTITNHRPDNAITLLDKVCAQVVLQRGYNIMICQDEDLKKHMQEAPVIVNASHVDNYLKEESFRLPDSFDSVKEKIYFRDAQIDALYVTISDYVKFDAIFPSGKPFRIDIAGPAKSGRTRLLKEVAALIDEQPVYLDLADYSDKPSLNRIIGSPFGYVGSDSKKEMPFDIIESNPRKVIILDNIDRCHLVVKEFFESAIGTGLIKYADNRVVDICKCIILVSSKEAKKSHPIGFTESNKQSGMSEIRLSALSKQEIVDAATRRIKKMVASLKAEHQKYNNIPDDPGVPESEKALLKSPQDIDIVVKRVILAML